MCWSLPWQVATAALVLLLSALAGGDEPEPQAQPTLRDDLALQAVLAEPKVSDAVITDAGVLYASVADDGTDRSGYAQYLLELISATPSSVRRVVVVAAGSQRDPRRDNAYGRHLGAADR